MRSPRVAPTPAPVASEPAPAAPTNIGADRRNYAMTTLHYIDSAPIRLIGPITGRAYAFSGAEPAQEVDVRDAAIFVRSVRFRRSAP